MEQMGRKDAAREIAVAAGVPVVPRGEDAGVPRPRQGGRRRRRQGHARSSAPQDELDEAVAAAKREAASAFGDDTMLVEKYVEHGRHIEVQVIADPHGTVRHLFERDCSTQRRHQKVLEEAPAPTIDAATRERVTSAAVALAEHVGYANAGTVEFLLDADTGEVYFLEMNTRLQVEHPVTELVVRRDSTWSSTSSGSRPASRCSIRRRRADRPRDRGAGLRRGLLRRLPPAGRHGDVGASGRRGVRVDQALESGQVVSTAYDPMLGKVIAHGPDREAARQALVAALDDTAILGLTTNAGFLRALVASDEFRDATIDTAWLDHHDVRGARPGAGARARGLGGLPPRPRGHRAVRVRRVPARRRPGAGRGRARRAGHPRRPAGRRRPVAAVRHDRVEVVHHGQRFVFERPDVMGDHAAAVGDGALTAPMPGTVLDVRVAEGDAVEEGQVLGVLEAMKMELSLKAPFAGTVTTVGAATGEQVALGDTLVRGGGVADDDCLSGSRSTRSARATACRTRSRWSPSTSRSSSYAGCSPPGCRSSRRRRSCTRSGCRSSPTPRS